MLRLSYSFTSPLPPGEVFARVADFGRLEEWDPGVASSRQLTPGPPAPGAEFRVVARFLGREVAMDYTLEEWDPPRLARYVGRTRRVTSRDEFRFDPADAGTDLHLAAEVTTSGWLRPLEPLLGLAMRLQGRSSLRALRARVAG